jgi:hypothetical protein
MNNSTEDLNDHPLELTVKDSQRSNRTVRVKNSKMVKNKTFLGSILLQCIQFRPIHQKEKMEIHHTSISKKVNQKTKPRFSLLQLMILGE